VAHRRRTRLSGLLALAAVQSPHNAQSSAAAECTGEYRWDIKTLSDDQANEVPGFAHVLVHTATHSLSLECCCPGRRQRSDGLCRGRARKRHRVVPFARSFSQSALPLAPGSLLPPACQLATRSGSTPTPQKRRNVVRRGHVCRDSAKTRHPRPTNPGRRHERGTDGRDSPFRRFASRFLRGEIVRIRFR